MQDGSVSPIKVFFRNKWVRLIFIIDFITIITIVAIAIINSAKNVTITFSITPVDATITVNGDSQYTNGTYRFFPGTYEIAISHPDLDTKIFTIDLQGQDAANITTFLSRGGDFSFYELKENYDSFYQLSQIASAGYNQTTDQDASAESFITKFQKQYELYSTALPVTYSEYDYDDFGKQYLSEYISARSDYNCDFTLCLKVIGVNSEHDKNLINSLLEEAGFDLEDFEIEYQIY